MYNVIEKIKTISEIEKELSEYDESVIFTEREIKQNEKKNRLRSLGARYLIKKSILNFFELKTRFQEIEILNNKLGKPELYFAKEAMEKINLRSYGTIQISISHSRNYVSSLVVFE